MDWILGADTVSDFNDWTLVFLHQPSTVEITMAVALVCAMLALSVYNLKRLPSSGWKAALFVLRLLFLAGLVAMWLQPALQLQKKIYRKSHVVMMVDRSQSMSLPANTGGRTRSELVYNFLGKNASWLQDLATKHHLRTFVFDSEAKPSPLSRLAETAKPIGENTAIEASLASAMENFRSGEVAGVLLFSDGRANQPDGPMPDADALVKRLKEQKIPVYTFGSGQEQGVRDIAIQDVRYDGFAFVHNRMSIEVDVSSRGYDQRAVQINLSRGGGPIASQNLNVDAEGVATATFSFTPDRVGRFVYSVEIPTSPDDSMPSNNRRSFVVDVIRDKIRVLHVCGHPDYDEMALRRYLKNNPNVDLISFFILRTNDDLQLVSEDELSLIPFPTEELFDTQLHTFDMVVFQNFTYLGYQMQQYLPNIQRYVREGGALLVIGGDVSYAAGGYDRTAVEEVLPFDIQKTDPAADAAPFQLRPTEAGLRHPIMRIRPGREANAAAWEASPELLGLNLGLVERSEALVLAVHPTLKTNGRPAPVIAAYRYGEGRSVALAVDSTWIWHFADVATGGEGDLYRTFWSNTIRWLIRDPELKHVALRADKDELAPGEELRIDLRLTDPDFQPKPDKPVWVEIVSEADGRVLHREEARTDSDGNALLVLDAPDVEGMVDVRVRADGEAGEPAQEENLLVYVTRDNRELRNVDVDFDRLRRLAKATGGRFYELPANIDEDIVFSRDQIARIGRKRDIPVWDNAGTLGLLIFLIALEWWLRKRRRLN